MLHQIRVCLVGILAGIPLLIVYLWFCLLAFVLRMRGQGQEFEGSDCLSSNGVRLVRSKCGCRHLEVMYIWGDALRVVRWHYGRCLHGKAEAGEGRS